MSFFVAHKGISQSTQTNANKIMGTLNAGGANAFSSSGTVAYSIGQVFYTYIGQSVYNVAQGIQHEEVAETLTKSQNNLDITTDIFIFPNPTSDFVTISMEGIAFENGLKTYQLFDIQGRLLRQNTINENETQVNLLDLNASIYILQVYVNNKVLKSFKILKK